MKKPIIAILAALLIGATAQAHLMNETQISATGSGNPDSEIADLVAWMPSLAPLTYLAKYEYDEAAFDPDGLFGAANFSASLFNPGPPATAEIMWNLTATGYILTAVVVKAGPDFLTAYTVSESQALMDLGGQTVKAPDNKDSISHITFFGKRASVKVPDSGATIALLGSALALFALGRRRAR